MVYVRNKSRWGGKVYTTKKGCEKECHQRWINFTYARLVQTNYFKAQLCAYSSATQIILWLQSMEMSFGYKQ